MSHKRSAFESKMICDCIKKLATESVRGYVTTEEIMQRINAKNPLLVTVGTIRFYLKYLVKTEEIVKIPGGDGMLSRGAYAIPSNLEIATASVQHDIHRLRSKSNKNRTKILVLPLSRKYFDEIRNGTKTEEYRKVNDYNTPRVSNPNLEFIEFRLGYPKKDDASKHMTFPWIGCFKRVIKHEHFGEEPVEVYVIPLRERIS